MTACEPSRPAGSAEALRADEVSPTLPVRGALAQLGERRLCKPEVAGSIPARSTRFHAGLRHPALPARAPLVPQTLADDTPHLAVREARSSGDLAHAVALVIRLADRVIATLLPLAQELGRSANCLRVKSSDASRTLSRRRSSTRRCNWQTFSAINWLDDHWRGGVFVPDELMPVVAVA